MNIFLKKTTQQSAGIILNEKTLRLREKVHAPTSQRGEVAGKVLLVVLRLTLVARCLTADAASSSSSPDSHGISELPPPHISKLVLYFLAPF